jgi:hypothetical protein
MQFERLMSLCFTLSSLFGLTFINIIKLTNIQTNKQKKTVCYLIL